MIIPNRRHINDLNKLYPYIKVIEVAIHNYLNRVEYLEKSGKIYESKKAFILDNKAKLQEVLKIIQHG